MVLLPFSCCAWWTFIVSPNEKKIAEKEQAKDQRKAMEEVLDYDSRTTDGARSAQEVVQRMRTIEERVGKACPADFRSAYLDHIHAWELLIEVERDLQTFNADYRSTGAKVEAFLRGATLDFGMARAASAEANRIKANYQRATTKLRETYHRVESIAVGYGASLPKRAPYGTN